MSRIHTLVAVWAVAAVAVVSVAGADAQSLSPGDQAPPFNLAGSDGQHHSLADYEGRTVVLAWFPKAFTAG